MGSPAGAGPPADETKKDWKDALKPPPKFTASLSTGRTIEEMYEHLDENVALLPGGVVGHVDAAFAHTMFQALKDVAQENAGRKDFGEEVHVEGQKVDPVKILTSFASFDMNYEFRYRSETPSGFDDLPKLDEGVGMFTKEFGSGPRCVLDPIGGLADFADGLKTLEITGLPSKYGLLVTFKNFHITPILKTMAAAPDDQDDTPVEPEPTDK